MRNLEPRGNVVRNRLYGTVNQTQSFMPPIFQAVVKQQLHPQANPQQRLASRHLLADQFIQVILPQQRGDVTERAHTWEDQFLRCPDHRRIAGNDRLSADGGEGALERKQVSHAVVNDGDHLTAPPW